jgi:hypothetical protein
MHTTKISIFIVACIVIFYLFVIFYFHLFHRFWSIQPMLHRYSLYALFRKKGCIKPLPLNNKYYSPLNIATLKYADVTDTVKHDLCVMLSEHFDTEGKSRIEKDIFSPLMESHNTDSFVSLYYKYSKIIGCLTGRPLKMYIDSEITPLFYIDHLCVDKDMRTKGIAYALMQTHEHNQRISDQDIQYSLFKRNVPIPSVVPFVSSRTYGFKTGLFKPCTFNAGITFERVASDGLHDFHEFLETYRSSFKYCILPALSHIAGLIESKHLVVYALKNCDSIVNVYIFKNVDIMKDKPCGIQLSCSIMSEPKDYIMNYSGLCAILSEVSNTYTNVFIENLSDNERLITSIMDQNHIPAYMETSSWYYLYNYHMRTKSPSEVLLLC